MAFIKVGHVDRNAAVRRLAGRRLAALLWERRRGTPASQPAGRQRSGRERQKVKVIIGMTAVQRFLYA
jgi:hypothetical protein